jgi:hypothetical protein
MPKVPIAHDADAQGTAGEAMTPKLPQPIAYEVEEGTYLLPWRAGEGVRGDGRLHAVFFDDGSVFDMYNGWRPYDPQTLQEVRAAIDEFDKPTAPNVLLWKLPDGSVITYDRAVELGLTFANG